MKISWGLIIIICIILLLWGIERRAQTGLLTDMIQSIEVMIKQNIKWANNITKIENELDNCQIEKGITQLQLLMPTDKRPQMYEIASHLIDQYNLTNISWEKDGITNYQWPLN